MSYTPTTWNSGDLITSTKLNKIEQGLAAASDLDSTLTVSGKPADSKAVGDEVAELKNDLSELNNGFDSISLSNDFQTALLNLVNHLAYTDTNGATYVSELVNSFPGAIDLNASTVNISYALTHAISSNSNTELPVGSSYTTTVSPDNDYSITYVLVTMGGTDITSTAYDRETGTIRISNVTRNVLIMVVGYSNWHINSTDLYTSFAMHDGGIDVDTTSGYLYLNTDNGNTRRTFVSTIPFGPKLRYWNGQHVPSGEISDYYLFKVPKNATGVTVTLTPSANQPNIQFRKLDSNGLITDESIQTSGGWASAGSYSLTFNETVLNELQSGTVLMTFISRYGSNLNYNENPSYVPTQVTIDFTDD